MNGRPVEWEGTEIQLKWAEDKPEIPLYVAAYGPRALGVAGRVGDGVIIQLADPAIIEWTMATARSAAEEAGRDPAALKCLVCAPSKVTDDLAARPRRGPLVPGDGRQPRRRHRPRARRDVRHPARADRLHQGPRRLRLQGPLARRARRTASFVPDEICDRFCVIGSAAQCVEKLRGLEAIGVDEWIVYLMTEGQDETLEAYGAEIIPAVNS